MEDVATKFPAKVLHLFPESFLGILRTCVLSSSSAYNGSSDYGQSGNLKRLITCLNGEFVNLYILSKYSSKSFIRSAYIPV